MSAEIQTSEQRRPKARWLILGAAVTFAVLACAAAIVIVMFYRENVPLVMGAATVAGVSLEVLLWTSAGVFGWGFLAKRREALGRWKRRFFGPKSEGSETP